MNVNPTNKVGGPNTLSVLAPADTVSNTDPGARFRLSTDPAAAVPTGAASDGEVKDHLVDPGPALPGTQADWGDLPDSYGTENDTNGPSHTILTTNNPQLGARIDADNDGQPASNAAGDDNDIGGNGDQIRGPPSGRAARG